MVSRANIQSEIYAPKKCAVELVSIYDTWRSVSFLAVIFLIVRHPFQHEFVVAVAVKVAYTHIVRTVFSFRATSGDLRSRSLCVESSAYISPRFCLECLAVACFNPVGVAGFAHGVV